MSLWERQREDQLLFAYWKGAKRMFAGFSDATIIEGFLTDFGPVCQTCTTEDLRQRLKRMKAEYLNDLRDQ